MFDNFLDTEREHSLEGNCCNGKQAYKETNIPHQRGEKKKACPPKETGKNLINAVMTRKTKTTKKKEKKRET